MQAEVQISDGSTVKASGDLISSEVGGETVALNLKSGIYYSLNSVGSRIWQLIQEPRSVRDIRRAILDEFDVDEQRCETDVHNLLKELAAKGLVEVRDEPAP